MPVTHFRIRWPDQTDMACYSPSSIVTEHFVEGTAYPLDEFVERARTALGAASERVRARYGYACSSAMDQLRILEIAAQRFRGQDGATVRFLGFGS
ncbi:hypothetical protein CNE_1c19220 [Cupriavidus necator N-1]|uniref:MSMEG_0570 family nitrogen starvation response protein n=1 Tax=Cupriavidus necator (strain ATCC 43291 / DSM 13513 / CCUG 52238 / LMG 8453 / N-1) TaxID=1042878 RepID=G0EXQ5_CUPNN|nr:MSMEG_0570 family nitrogen starvation response protein [Cupriavidus necator]AEI77262.1 hypothetical protein CNE_1c19220 [Cupriavidus necator N-1]MDX6014185.1 MSMEG_0570 family nitrogen starvation response protein [Cupriavidus necator]